MQPKNDTRPPFERVWRLLLEAARIATEEDMDVETFTSAGFRAYVKNSPEIIEAIEDSRISEHVEALRRAGRLATA
jgi:hypothetical protein